MAKCLHFDDVRRAKQPEIAFFFLNLFAAFAYSGSPAGRPNHTDTVEGKQQRASFQRSPAIVSNVISSDLQEDFQQKLTCAIFSAISCKIRVLSVIAPELRGRSHKLPLITNHFWFSRSQRFAMASHSSSTVYPKLLNHNNRSAGAFGALEIHETTKIARWPFMPTN